MVQCRAQVDRDRLWAWGWEQWEVWVSWHAASLRRDDGPRIERQRLLEWEEVQRWEK